MAVATALGVRDEHHEMGAESMKVKILVEFDVTTDDAVEMQGFTVKMGTDHE